MSDKLFLFTPGPVMTSDKVKQSMAHSDIPHRRKTFENYLERNRANLLRLYNANDEYTAIMVTGSGTASNETALSSIIKETDEVLLIKNGVFGDRLDDILSCYNYTIHRLEFTWGEAPDVDAIDKALAENENIQWVCMVYQETSTGMRNPVGEIGAVVKKNGRKYFVDCVSAIGGEDVNVVRDHIDVASGSANKAVSGPTGISFVCAKRSSVPSMDDVPRRNIYLNLQNHIKWAEERSQTPNTPAVTNFIGLDAALTELHEEGIENRIARYQSCRTIIRDGLQKLGLKLLLSEETSSNTVTSVFLPEGVDVVGFIDDMEERGYVLYPGKGPFHERNMFQVANMGWLPEEECHKLLAVIGEVISK